MSEDYSRVIALVGAREHVVKSRVFGRACSGLKHFRRVGSDRKTRYLGFFRKRYAKLESLLETARVFLSIEELRLFIDNISPHIAIAVVDDKLYNDINTWPKIKESDPKPRYMNFQFYCLDPGARPPRHGKAHGLYLPHRLSILLPRSGAPLSL